MWQNWQPIETAPKGTLVLISGGKWLTTHKKELGRKPEPFEGVTIGVLYDKWVDGRFPWVSQSICRTLDDNQQAHHEPTHWMPLPMPVNGPAPID